MVASPHSLASAAGVDALRAGGSAVDAALATGAALSVLYPHMTSVGGDAFWLVYDVRTRRVRYLNGGGCAARGAGIDWFRARGMKEVPLRGFLPATLTTPGAVASWCLAHEEYGRLPLARDLACAIGYAREGFPVTGRLARAIELHASDGSLAAGGSPSSPPEAPRPVQGTSSSTAGSRWFSSGSRRAVTKASTEATPPARSPLFPRREAGFSTMQTCAPSGQAGASRFQAATVAWRSSKPRRRPRASRCSRC